MPHDDEPAIAKTSHVSMALRLGLSGIDPKLTADALPIGVVPLPVHAVLRAVLMIGHPNDHEPTVGEPGSRRGKLIVGRVPIDQKLRSRLGRRRCFSYSYLDERRRRKGHYRGERQFPRP